MNVEWSFIFFSHEKSLKKKDTQVELPDGGKYVQIEDGCTRGGSAFKIT